MTNDNDLILRGDALECFMGLDRIGDIKDAIAALPSVKQTGAVTPAVKAKPLVWEDGQHDRKFSKTPIGQYSARDFGEGNFWADYNGQLLRPSNYTPEAAKSVAQADYEARILAAIEPQPDPRTADYEQAYKYALTLADALMAKHYPDNKDWRPLGDLTGLLTQIDNMVAGKKPDPRDAVIARLVEALEMMRSTYPYNPPCYGWREQVEAHKAAKVALAAAKEVMK